MTINKHNLVQAAAKDANITQAVAEKVIDSVFESISAAIAVGNEVKVSGFGTFSVKERAAHMGRNPQTKEEILIPASKTPAFRASTTLKSRVKQ